MNIIQLALAVRLVHHNLTLKLTASVKVHLYQMSPLKKSLLSRLQIKMIHVKKKFSKYLDGSSLSEVNSLTLMKLQVSEKEMRAQEIVTIIH